MDASDSYAKKHYEVTLISSDRYQSTIHSPIARLHNSLVNAMSQHASLPKMLVIIIEDDFIKYLEHNDYGATELFGKVLNYIESELQKTILKFKRMLPPKAVKLGFPQMVWIAPSLHQNYINNTMRKKFAAELDVQLRGRPFMIILRLKHVWDQNDDRLVEDNGRLSRLGRITLWQAIDCSIAFADRILFNNTRNKTPTYRRGQGNCRRSFSGCKRRLPTPPKKR